MSTIKWYPGSVSSLDLTGYPGTRLDDISILELGSNPAGLSIYEVTETILPVESNENYLLLFCPLDPYIPGNFSATSDTTDLVPIGLAAATIGTTGIGINAGINKVRIHATAHIGKTISLTYKTGVSGITPTLFGVLWGNVCAMQRAGTSSDLSSVSTSGIAGETLDNVFTYMENDGRFYTCGTPSIDFPPSHYCPTGSIGVETNGYRSGVLRMAIEMPAKTVILAGRNGKPTWLGDTSANKLLSGDPMFPVGYRGNDLYTLVLSIGYQNGWVA